LDVYREIDCSGGEVQGGGDDDDGDDDDNDNDVLNLFVILREEYRFALFDKGGRRKVFSIKRKEVAGVWRKIIWRK